MRDKQNADWNGVGVAQIQYMTGGGLTSTKCHRSVDFLPLVDKDLQNLDKVDPGGDCVNILMLVEEASSLSWPRVSLQDNNNTSWIN
eukprot:NODE_2837_length_635_cov_92.860068_g2361_i0.p1 GENE.NODE_2837_length_635_cov_92.860068_g2361_i0~~NODE_2837_length_635_cov_92.860068_g2361_i0.p1  ORF type:complete len:87 (+),score=15.67 NODE_2837_length_635_cov_92.860068_g2361_i0:312-572(+)